MNYRFIYKSRAPRGPVMRMQGGQYGRSYFSTERSNDRVFRGPCICTDHACMNCADLTFNDNVDEEDATYSANLNSRLDEESFDQDKGLQEGAEVLRRCFKGFARGRPLQGAFGWVRFAAGRRGG